MNFIIMSVHKCEDSSDSCKLGDRGVVVKEMDSRDLGKALGYEAGSVSCNGTIRIQFVFENPC